MSDPALGLLMLTLIVVVIMMGFPTAFTLMGLGILFGFVAFFDPAQHWVDNKIFDLMVQRTYGAMTNDVLISIPLFVLMGYVMERGALVDKMFYSIQLAFRRVPASLAVATLIVCTFWGIASGLVGAVVVLMGVIAFNPMLKAGYDVRLASGVITAGGTLGILIPPSVMIIVYAAVAGQSVVKLYAAAMFPGFFLSFLYLVYIIGWALLSPKIAPPLSEEQTRVPVPAWVPSFQQAFSSNMFVAALRALVSPAKAKAIQIDGRSMKYREVLAMLCYSLVPLTIIAVTLWSAWWYVVIHQQAAPEQVVEGLQQLGSAPVEKSQTPAEQGPPAGFVMWFGIIAAVMAVVMARYYARMTAERYEVIKLLTTSIAPLGILTFVVLAVILFGITTATESAAVGAAGAFLLAFQARTLDWKRTKEAVFLTAKTTSMVCWLFVGSAIFSGVFAILGGQALIEKWVLSLNMTPLQFMLLVPGHHLRARLAAGMDRDHRDLRADLPAIAQALQHRPDSVGHAGVREPAGSVPVAAGRHVRVLSEGGGAKARHPQPDLRRHDALHADRYSVHGIHVCLARDDALAAEFPVWGGVGRRQRRKCLAGYSRLPSTLVSSGNWE